LLFSCRTYTRAPNLVGPNPVRREFARTFSRPAFSGNGT
jgi:hypothetical protein